MPFGPGKYDNLTTHVREEAKAKGAIVIIFEGNKGSGFSCQTSPHALHSMPELLEHIAQQLRESREELEQTRH
jgi:hypothetical protein